jgi:hypothetical protein
MMNLFTITINDIFVLFVLIASKGPLLAVVRPESF